MTRQQILVVDKHALTRMGLCAALNALERPMLIREVDSIPKAQEIIDAQVFPDILIVHAGYDVGFNLAEVLALTHGRAKAKVIITGAEREQKMWEKSFAIGALAYLPFDIGLQDFDQAIQTVAVGQRWSTPSHALAGGHRADVEIARRIYRLSPRQFDVLKMVAEGKLNKQIGGELNMAVATVKHHVSSILRTLGLVNRTQASVLFHSLYG